MLSRFGLCLAAVLATPALFAGCYNEDAEGDRCNPLQSSNDCHSGLVCAGYPIGQSAAYPIPFCPENYCCPVDVSASESPFCQPGCNGGAAAICAADGYDAGDPACAFALCAVDAADPSSCLTETENDGAADATSDGSVAESGAATDSSAAADSGEAASPLDGGDASTLD